MRPPRNSDDEHTSSTLEKKKSTEPQRLDPLRLSIQDNNLEASASKYPRCWKHIVKLKINKGQKPSVMVTSG